MERSERRGVGRFRERDGAIASELHVQVACGVHDVRIGRLVELETDDPSKLDALCEKLLANPLIEEFEVELEQ